MIFSISQNTYFLTEGGDCGGYFTNASGIITSPGYPNSYGDLCNPSSCGFHRCIYNISQPVGTCLKLTLLSIDIPAYNAAEFGPWPYNYDFDSVDGVHCSPDKFLQIKEFILCGNESDTALPAMFNSTENDGIPVLFVNRDNSSLKGKGFMLKFERHNCSSIEDAEEGISIQMSQ